jgi:hypothetical protein
MDHVPGNARTIPVAFQPSADKIPAIVTTGRGPKRRVTGGHLGRAAIHESSGKSLQSASSGEHASRVRQPIRPEAIQADRTDMHNEAASGGRKGEERQSRARRRYWRDAEQVVRSGRSASGIGRGGLGRAPDSNCPRFDARAASPRFPGRVDDGLYSVRTFSAASRHRRAIGTHCAAD